jgi:hypothetical protein
MLTIDDGILMIRRDALRRCDYETHMDVDYVCDMFACHALIYAVVAR